MEMVVPPPHHLHRHIPRRIPRHTPRHTPHRIPRRTPHRSPVAVVLTAAAVDAVAEKPPMQCPDGAEEAWELHLGWPGGDSVNY